jgi:hypothetical protein
MGTEGKVAAITDPSFVKTYRERIYRIIETARPIRRPDDANIAAVSGDIDERKTAEQMVSEAMAQFRRIDMPACSVQNHLPTILRPTFPPRSASVRPDYRIADEGRPDCNRLVLDRNGDRKSSPHA